MVIRIKFLWKKEIIKTLTLHKRKVHIKKKFMNFRIKES